MVATKGETVGSKLPWLDTQGLLHAPGAPPIAIESAAGQAWLAAAGAFTVQLGAEHFTVRAEIQNERRYWYATRRCGGKLHRWYIGLPGALTLGRLQEIAGEVKLRCAGTGQLAVLDMQAAQTLVVEARAALEQQGRLGQRVGQQLLSLAEQAIAELEAAQQLLAALEPPDEPEAAEDQAPVTLPPQPASIQSQSSSSVKLVGATEDDVLAQIAEQRERFGDRLIIGSPTLAPRGGWMAYGLLRSDQLISDQLPSDIGTDPAPVQQPTALPLYEAPMEEPVISDFPALDTEVRRVLAVQQSLHRFLDQHHDQGLLNAKRGQALVELLREALAHRQRVLMIELLLESLPQLALEKEEKQAQILAMILLAAARKPALQKLRDQVEDQAAIVAMNVAESRKLVGRARSRILNLAWKIHGELGTSRLQRLWHETVAAELAPEHWVDALISATATTLENGK